VYFDNDVKVRAPFDAMNLYCRLEGKPLDADGAPDAADIAEVPRTTWPGFRRRPAPPPTPRRASRPRRTGPPRDKWGKPLASKS
jgi:hypothetical protein